MPQQVERVDEDIVVGLKNPTSVRTSLVNPLHGTDSFVRQVVVGVEEVFLDDVSVLLGLELDGALDALTRSVVGRATHEKDDANFDVVIGRRTPSLTYDDAPLVVIWGGMHVGEDVDVLIIAYVWIVEYVFERVWIDDLSRVWQ